MIKIADWANRWMVKFNYNKTVAMNFSCKLSKSLLKLNFNEPKSLVNEHKHLGLLLSDDMKWSKHIKCCVSSANRKLGMLIDCDLI